MTMMFMQCCCVFLWIFNCTADHRAHPAIPSQPRVYLRDMSMHKLTNTIPCPKRGKKTRQKKERRRERKKERGRETDRVSCDVQLIHHSRKHSIIRTRKHLFILSSKSAGCQTVHPFKADEQNKFCSKNEENRKKVQLCCRRVRYEKAKPKICSAEKKTQNRASA